MPYDHGVVMTSVSNGTGQRNFSGQRDRSSIIVPGQMRRRDKLKILPRDGKGRDSQNLGRDGPGQPNPGTGRGTKLILGTLSTLMTQTMVEKLIYSMLK